jgi:hypothetical protein
VTAGDHVHLFTDQSRYAKHLALAGTATTGSTDALWFTAGINHEQNGLLGVLRP